MCKGCYAGFKDEHPTELPTAMTEGMETLVRLINQFYEDWPTGGALHIVLDDWNLEDDNIIWCINEMEKYGYDTRVPQIGNALLKLSEAERYEVMNHVY